MPCSLFTQRQLLDANAFCFPVPRQNTGSVMNWMKEEQECHPVSEYGKDKVLVYQQATKGGKRTWGRLHPYPYFQRVWSGGSSMVFDRDLYPDFLS